RVAGVPGFVHLCSIHDHPLLIGLLPRQHRGAIAADVGCAHFLFYLPDRHLPRRGEALALYTCSGGFHLVHPSAVVAPVHMAAYGCDGRSDSADSGCCRWDVRVGVEEVREWEFVGDAGVSNVFSSEYVQTSMSQVCTYSEEKPNHA